MWSKFDCMTHRVRSSRLHLEIIIKLNYNTHQKGSKRGFQSNPICFMQSENVNDMHLRQLLHIHKPVQKLGSDQFQVDSKEIYKKLDMSYKIRI